MRPRWKAVLSMDNSRLQVASLRPSASRLRRYSFSIAVLRLAAFRCPKNGLRLASTTSFQILSVDALTLCLACFQQVIEEFSTGDLVGRGRPHLPSGLFPQQLIS